MIKLTIIVALGLIAIVQAKPISDSTNITQAESGQNKTLLVKIKKRDYNGLTNSDYNREQFNDGVSNILGNQLEYINSKPLNVIEQQANVNMNNPSLFPNQPPLVQPQDNNAFNTGGQQVNPNQWNSNQFNVNQANGNQNWNPIWNQNQNQNQNWNQNNNQNWNQNNNQNWNQNQNNNQYWNQNNNNNNQNGWKPSYNFMRTTPRPSTSSSTSAYNNYWNYNDAGESYSKSFDPYAGMTTRQLPVTPQVLWFSRYVDLTAPIAAVPFSNYNNI